MDAQEGGGELCFKINAQIKQHKGYTGSVYLTYVQSSTTQAESFTITQVLNRVHLKPYNRKFYGLTCNLTTSFTLAHL